MGWKLKMMAGGKARLVDAASGFELVGEDDAPIEFDLPAAPALPSAPSAPAASAAALPPGYVRTGGNGTEVSTAPPDDEDALTRQLQATERGRDILRDAAAKGISVKQLVKQAAAALG